MKSDHTYHRLRKSTDFLIGYQNYEHETFAPPLQIVTAGAAFWFDRRQHERKDSDIFGIEYVTMGSMAFVQEGRRYVVGPGQAYILHQGRSHLYRVGPTGMVHKRYVTMKGPLLDSALRATGLNATDVVVPRSPHGLTAIFRSVNAAMRLPRDEAVAKLSILGYQLLLELGRNLAQQHPAPVRRALDCMEQHLGRTIDMASVGRQAGLSLTHLNRLFRQYLHLSPKQYYLSRKMSWAKHLLRDSSQSVKEIAAGLGYQNPLYFSAQFRAHVGMSPRQFRDSGIGTESR